MTRETESGRPATAQELLRSDRAPGRDGRRRLGRRQLLKLAGAGSAAAIAAGLGRPALAANDQATPRPLVAGPVYVQATGHHVTGRLLDWWLQHGRERALGWPVSEPVTVDGVVHQFFEHSVLALRDDGRDPLGVTALNVGQHWLDRKREEGLRIERVDTVTAFWFWQTGHGVHPEFWPMFRDGGGAFAFGYPLTGGLVIDGQLTQVFQRACFTLAPYGLAAKSLGLWQARQWSVPTHPVEPQENAVAYEAADLVPDYGELEDRWADVDLTRQLATFYVGYRPVYQALISSGRHPTFTPPGEWRIWKRVENEHMIGGDPEQGDYYDLLNVYFTQYFTERYAGFHYAYWHDEFGTPTSHGCVNMRLDDSRWAWDFLGEGSRVSVRR